jgi:hypothetical protein
MLTKHSRSVMTVNRGRKRFLYLYDEAERHGPIIIGPCGEGCIFHS